MNLRFSMVITALLLPLLAGCEKSDEQTYRGKTPPLSDVQITVNISSPLPRAGIASGKLKWNAGDSISVFDGYGTRTFRCTGSGASAVFSGKACKADKYTAVWPASSAAAFSSGKASVLVPPVQKAVLGSIPQEGYPMAGTAASGAEMSLEPAAALLSIEIAEGNKALGSIRISSGPYEILSGYQIVNVSGGQPVMLGKSNSVTLLPEGDSFGTGIYYAAVSPSALADGLDIRIESSYYAPYSEHLDVAGDALAKGIVLPLGVFDPSSSLVEEEANDPAGDPASAYGFDFAALGGSRHPRLLMNADDFVRLRKLVSLPGSDAQVIRSLHQEVIHLADRQLRDADELPSPESLTKNEFLNNVARTAIYRIFSTAYAWRTTGEEKYLSYARATLSRLCSLSTWMPQHYLGAAESLFAAAIAYDWLYYDLTLEERSAARAAMLALGMEEGAKASVRKQWTNGVNWNQVCNSGLLAASLVTYEKNKELAAGLIDSAVESNLARLDEIYGDDGVYSEGYGYWEYGSVYQAILGTALQDLFGTTVGIGDHTGLRNTANYMLYMSDGTSTFAYGDGGRYASQPLMAQWWLAGITGNPSLLFNEVYLLRNTTKYTGSSRFLPLLPCWLAKDAALREGVEGALAPPADLMWSGNGSVPMVMMRDAWNCDGSDTYLAMKGGRAYCSHGHMDAGMFVYTRYGVRWVDEIFFTDASTTGGYASYEDALSAAGGSFWSHTQQSLRWDIFVMSSLAHSTVSFENGSDLGRIHDTDHDVMGMATLSSTINENGSLGGVFDMSPTYEGQVASATRSCVLLPSGDAQITDVITALPDQDALLQWRIPTRVTADVLPDCIELSSGGYDFFLYTESSQSSVKPVYTDFGTVRPTGLWGWVARDWDKAFWDRYSIVGYKATIPAGTTVSLRTLITTAAPGQGSGGAINERPER